MLFFCFCCDTCHPPARHLTTTAKRLSKKGACTTTKWTTLRFSIVLCRKRSSREMRGKNFAKPEGLPAAHVNT